MTKVQIKPKKFTPVGGLFYVANQFMHHIMPHVDNYLGRRSQLHRKGHKATLGT